MVQGLKTSVAILAGLLLGLAAALPLAWYGSRRGADALVHNVGHAVEAVELRQQAMADQALRLQPMLLTWRVPVESDLFEAVQDARSRLAGAVRVSEKLLRVQDLEESLLRIEERWRQAGAANSRLARSYEWSEWGRVWEKQKRLLVREQFAVQDAVEEVNRLLVTPPAAWMLKYKSVGALLRGTFGDVLGNTAFLFRLSLDYLGYGMRKVAALVGQQDPPQPPQWDRPKVGKEEAYLAPLRPPVFLAGAPLPEDEYEELQYTSEPGVDYADVKVGADPAVLENRHAPAPFSAPTPSVQKTVDYRTPR
jgi:hypothetical protein